MTFGRMIDLHFHLLPGLDDGPATMRDAVALARAARSTGTRTVAATPHIDHRWRVSPEQVHAAVDRVRAALEQAGIDLEVVAGGEIALTRFLELSDDQLQAVRLGGGPYLLIESPHTSSTGDVDWLVREVLIRGYGVLLAHPERCPTFHRQPEQLARLVDHGVLCSITAGSLAGSFGRRVRLLALRLLGEGLVHNVASDAHEVAGRDPDLLAGFESAERDLPGLREHVPWLTEQVPAAILSGTDLPARPPPPHPRRGRRWLEWAR